MLPQEHQDIKAIYENARVILHNAEKGIDQETAKSLFDILRETKKGESIFAVECRQYGVNEPLVKDQWHVVN
jgi:lipopolysaccharide biosynthesis glycosyltransferase